MNTNIHNILIVGYGFVGRAVHHSLIADRSLSDAGPGQFNIAILDPAKGLSGNLGAEADAVFVCVPTPTVDGVCDDSIVISVVEQFKDYQCPIIVRSTIPPSSIKKLLAIRSDIVYMPEFLRESHWKEDAVKPNMIVIGTHSYSTYWKVIDILESSSINLLKTHVKHVSPIEASLFKYAANTFLAMKVVYMHQLQRWMDSSGYVDHSWEVLQDLMKSDPRLGTSHFEAPGHHGYGYAGSCFPKDTQAFVTESAGQLSLLQDVIDNNTRLRNSV